MNSFSGVGVVDESSDSERKYYSQLFYRSYLSHQQRHEIHIIFAWNTEAHIYVSFSSSFYLRLLLVSIIIIILCTCSKHVVNIPKRISLLATTRALN